MKNSSPPSQIYSVNGSLVATKSALLDPLVQEQWIQPMLLLSIVSHSHLLCEALIHLFQTDWMGSLENHCFDHANATLSVTNPAQHLVLIDYGTGRESTITYIKQWRSRPSYPYVVVVELHNDSDLILDCIEAGAHGYVLQGAASAEVIQVMEQVYRGVAICPPEITAKLFERLAQAKPLLEKVVTPSSKAASREKPALTQRELEVLNYLVRGDRDRDIALELVIEVRTVKHHVHNLLRKLKVKHRWQAAQLAIEQGWLSQSEKLL
jgi:DNA-binding NarL/FixJ family response regulator